jgi:hypothetical protein
VNNQLTVMRLMQFEEIEQLLLQVPRIAELRDSQPTGYVARAAIWMDLLEQALVAAGAAESTRVDALRGELVFARHTVARDAVETTPQSTRTRKLAIDTAFAMDEAAHLADTVLNDQRPRFADAEKRLHVLIAKVRSQGLVTKNGKPSADQLGDIQRAIASRPDLEAEYREIGAIVGPDDCRLLLTRALTTPESAGVANPR